MRLTVLQLAATWNDKARVLADVDALLARAPTDLVLLPEAALTGYVSPALDFDLGPFAEPHGGPTDVALAALALRHRCAIVGPVIRRRGAHVYNAMAAHDAEGGHLFTYEKRHPWYPETWATAGDAKPPVVTLAGQTITVAICYDLQFVDDDPDDALRAADLLLFPSAWVDPDDSRLPLLQRIAARFDLWIANSNWSAGVVEVPGQGHSCVIDRSGHVVADAGASAGRIDVEI